MVEAFLRKYALAIQPDEPDRARLILHGLSVPLSASTTTSMSVDILRSWLGDYYNEDVTTEIGFLRVTATEANWVAVSKLLSKFSEFVTSLQVAMSLPGRLFMDGHEYDMRWLGALSVICQDGVASSEILNRVAAVAPCLRRIHLVGPGRIPALGSLRTLELDGPSAQCVDGSTIYHTIENLALLDISDEGIGEQIGAVSAYVFPCLRRLDLGRKNGNQHTRVIRMLSHLGTLPSLTHVRIPRVDSGESEAECQRWLDGNPQLEMVVVAEGSTASLSHGKARIIVDRKHTWPARNDRPRSFFVEFDVRGVKVVVDMSEMLEIVEDVYEVMHPVHQGAWNLMGSAISALFNDDERSAAISERNIAIALWSVSRQRLSAAWKTLTKLVSRESEQRAVLRISHLSLVVTDSSPW
jgi:hypothetical protein